MKHLTVWTLVASLKFAASKSFPQRARPVAVQPRGRAGRFVSESCWICDKSSFTSNMFWKSLENQPPVTQQKSRWKGGQLWQLSSTKNGPFDRSSRFDEHLMPSNPSQLEISALSYSVATTDPLRTASFPRCIGKTNNKKGCWTIAKEPLVACLVFLRLLWPTVKHVKDILKQSIFFTFSIVCMCLYSFHFNPFAIELATVSICNMLKPWWATLPVSRPSAVAHSNPSPSPTRYHPAPRRCRVVRCYSPHSSPFNWSDSTADLPLWDQDF